MSLLNNLPHVCNIQHKVNTKGSLGGMKNTIVEDSVRVVCWEQQASSKEIIEYEKRGMVVTRKVYFATDPEVTERHEIVITSRDGGKHLIPMAERVPLEVRSEARPDAGAGLGVVFRVMVEERTGASQ